MARLREAVALHPLDLADPDRHARQIGRVRVELDALGVGPPDLLKRTLEAEGLPLELHSTLAVLEGLQRQTEEVPQAAGRIEYRKIAQPAQERPVPTLGVAAPFHPRGARLGGLRALQFGCDRRLPPLPLGEQRPDHHRLDQLQDLLAVRCSARLPGSSPRSNSVPGSRVDLDQSRVDSASSVSKPIRPLDAVTGQLAGEPSTAWRSIRVNMSPGSGRDGEIAARRSGAPSRSQP